MAGMFDGMAAPFLVYRGATFLPPLCDGRGPVVHIGRRDVEHVADASRAGAVGELVGNRGPRRAGVGRHEGAAQAEPVEVGAEALGGHAPEARDERIEERMDGVDPVDGVPGAVLGVVCLVRGDPELREDVEVGGLPVDRDDGARRDAAPQRVHGAPPRQGAPLSDLEKYLVRVDRATRRPSSGGAACSQRCPSTRTGSSRATPSGRTRPT